jgi:hypothetical protein
MWGISHVVCKSWIAEELFDNFQHIMPNELDGMGCSVAGELHFRDLPLCKTRE